LRERALWGWRPCHAGRSIVCSSTPTLRHGLLDPPYAKGFDLAALKGLAQGWLHADSLVVLERGRGEPALAPPGFEVLDSRSYGAAEVSFLTLSKISA